MSQRTCEEENVNRLLEGGNLRIWLLVTAAAALLFLPVMPRAVAQQSAPAGNLQNGTEIYKKYGCWQCHGYAGQGGAAGPKIGPQPIAFAAFSRYVRQPAGQMPPYSPKVLKDSEMADIYAFVQSLPAPPSVDSIAILKD